MSSNISNTGSIEGFKNHTQDKSDLHTLHGSQLHQSPKILDGAKLTTRNIMSITDVDTSKNNNNPYIANTKSVRYDSDSMKLIAEALERHTKAQASDLRPKE